MRKSSIYILFSAALLGATAATPVFASGSFSGRPPKPPSQSGATMKVDSEKYTLGQKVYEGSVMTPGAGNADAQRSRLKTLQMKLPADARKLESLAGELSDQQLDALEYFVDQRFGMKH